MSATHTGRGDMFHNAGTQNICKDNGIQILQAGPTEEEKNDRQCSDYMQQNGYDPADQKANAERKGGQLFEPACEWIFKNLEFQHWRDAADPPSLWLHGGPGKGKTMLLCSVINRLLEPAEGAPDATDPSPLVTYSFFSDRDGVCEASSVVASLIYGLVKQQPSCLHCISKDYDHDSKYPFQGKQSFTALEKILEDMLRHKTGARVILVVDALDECTTDLKRLLDLILKTSSLKDVTWLVSSRGLRSIHQEFDATESNMRKLSLDQTGNEIQQAAQAYTNHRLKRLHILNLREEEREKLQERLVRKAGGTFLWLSIVMAELEESSSWNIDDIVENVEGLPEHLESLYETLLRKLLDEIGQKRTRNKLDRDILHKTLATAVAAVRPLDIEELEKLVGFPSKIYRISQVKEVVNKCGAFLTSQNNQVFLIHLSAKEFLTPEKLQSAFQSSRLDIHSHLFSRSMSVIKENLKRDIFNLEKPGIGISGIDLIPYSNPLSGIGYSCTHWIDHLEQVQFQKGPHCQVVRLFIEKSFLHWVEAMSFLGEMREASTITHKLRSLMGIEDYELGTLTEDIDLFVQVHGETIWSYPLQTYVSALLFSPTSSYVRRFYREEPDWISLKSNSKTTWSPRAKNLSMGAPPCMMAISTDGKLLASICRLDWQDKEREREKEREWEWEQEEWEWEAAYPHSQRPSSLLEIWDLNSDVPIRMLGLNFIVLALRFLRDGKRLALAGNPNRFEIWNAEKGTRLQTLQSPDEPSVWFTSLAVPTSTYLGPVKKRRDPTMNGDLIVSGSNNGAVKLWNLATGDCIRSIRTPGESIDALEFLQDGQKLAVGLGNGTVEVWDFRLGKLVWELKAHDDSITSMAFSGGDQLASTSEMERIKIWDLKTGGCIRTIPTSGAMVVSLESGGRFASVVNGKETVRIWNDEGDCIQRLEGSKWGSTNNLVFRPEQQLLALATNSRVDIWDLKQFRFSSIPLHIKPVLSTTLSSDSRLFASGSYDSIKIWDTTDGTCIRSMDCAEVGGRELAFSPNSRYLSSRGRYDWLNENFTQLTIWNVEDGQVVKTFSDAWGWEAFSPDGRLLALALGSSVMVWDMDASKQHHQIQCRATCLVFSADGKRLALASNTELEIWDMSSGECIWTVGHQQTEITSIALSADTKLLAAGRHRGIDVWDVSYKELRVSISAGRIFQNTLDAVGFSPNGELLAWIRDGEIGMGNLEDGRVARFSFDSRFVAIYKSLSPELSGRATIQFKRPDYSRLCTSIGDLGINADGTLTGFHGFHLDRNHEWVMKGKERMVLLPTEYRGGPASILSGQGIAIGGRGGGIFFFQPV